MPDLLKELMRAFDESGADSRRVYATLYVGTRNEVIAGISCRRGNTEEFRHGYNSLRETCRSSNQPGWIQSEIGPIENKLFFFSDDSVALDPPLWKDKRRKKDAFNVIPNEWAAFFLILTFGQERSKINLKKRVCREILKIWRKRVIPYNQANDRIAAMVIAPRPVGQKYGHEDVYY